MNETNLAQFLIEHLVNWAAYLVAALVGLLYTITRAELTALRASIGKMISREDFEKHEVREDKAGDERRAAEHSIREMVGTLDMRMQVSLGALDSKMDGKLTTILNNMIVAAQASHNRRDGDP